MARKEVVIGQTYLGIKIFRFYFNCNTCSAELTFKTDPENSGYVVEVGKTDNNFEREKRKRDEEYMGDYAMKSLEKRSVESKRELDTRANLDELKSMNKRRASVTLEAMLEASKKLHEKELEQRVESATNWVDLKTRAATKIQR